MKTPDSGLQAQVDPKEQVKRAFLAKVKDLNPNTLEATKMVLAKLIRKGLDNMTISSVFADPAKIMYENMDDIPNVESAREALALLSQDEKNLVGNNITIEEASELINQVK